MPIRYSLPLVLALTGCGAASELPQPESDSSASPCENAAPSQQALDNLRGQFKDTFADIAFVTTNATGGDNKFQNDVSLVSKNETTGTDQTIECEINEKTVFGGPFCQWENPGSPQTKFGLAPYRSVWTGTLTISQVPAAVMALFPSPAQIESIRFISHIIYTPPGSTGPSGQAAPYGRSDELSIYMMEDHCVISTGSDAKENEDQTGKSHIDLPIGTVCFADCQNVKSVTIQNIDDAYQNGIEKLKSF